MYFDKTTQNLCDRLKTHWDCSNVKKNISGVILLYVHHAYEDPSVCHSLSQSTVRPREGGVCEGVCTHFFYFLQHFHCQVSSSRAHFQNDIRAAQGGLRTHSIPSAPSHPFRAITRL